MANFFKYSLKRKDSKPRKEEPLRWFETDVFFRAVLAVVFIAVSLLVFPRAESTKFAELKEGSISNEEIIAPFTFYVEKSEEELKAEQEAAKKNVLPVFNRIDSIQVAQSRQLKDLEEEIQRILTSAEPDSVKRGEISLLLNQHQIALSEDYLNFFLQAAHSRRGKKHPLQGYFAQINRVLQEVYSAGILNVNKDAIRNAKNSISLRVDGKEETKPLTQVFEIGEAKQYLITRLRSLYRNSQDSVKVAYALLDVHLKPNLYFDEEETSRRIQEAVAKIPRVKGTILAGERIIDSHQRVTREHVEILRSLAKELRARRSKTSVFLDVLLWFGKILLIVLTQVPLLLFIYFHRRKVWEDRIMLLVIFGTTLFVVLFAYGVGHYHLPKYLIPVALVPIVVTSYLDTRTGFFAALGASLLLGAQLGFDYEFALMGLVTSAMAILALGFSRYRKKLANATLFLWGTYTVGVWTLGLLRFQSLHEILVQWGGSVAAGVLAPMMAYGFILIFDSAFDVASEFKLIELSDLNHPLLKMFAMRAPGSYHHSLQVSTLAEAAAEAIGANALLVRVGAYYHDIGKMFMPEYFVENQRGGKNPHDKLAPRISALILLNHVRKGYEFARENGLPTVVCNFIIEHHGGSLMKYFYEKAKEQAKGEEVLESDFRYPGRRPQSKETGILMLADSVEAMVRSIKEPTIGKIRNAVRNMVEEKIHDGDLDDCPLTMKDLRIIVETFSHVLMGMHHERIEYPGQKELEKKTAALLTSGGNP